MAQIKFLEWTGVDQGRHTRFVGLRDDKNPFEVVREHRQAFSARPGPVSTTSILNTAAVGVVETRRSL
jgi:hypothetical protein